MSFLDDYTAYASEFTDAPVSTHFRVALSLLSVCLNRKVYIHQGDDQTYPNLWLMIVAPSGWNRKSTSMRIGMKILDRVDQNYIMSNDFSSREKFVKCIANKPRGIMFISEFKSFMGMLSRDYMAGMQSVLTELFDNPPAYKKETTKEGDISINEPFLNFLACTTVEWLANSIKDDDIAGGFLPRYLIFCAPKRDTSMAFQPKANEEKKIELVKQLSKINNIKGELLFSPEAITYYTDWYKNFEKSSESLPGTLISFYVRLADYAKKFGIIYCVDRCFDKLDNFWADGAYNIQSEEITKEDMEKACTLAETFAEELAGFMDVEISFSYKEKIKKKVEKAIRDKYPNHISRAGLLQEVRILTKDLSPILETLEEERKIRIEETQVTGTGRRKIYTQQEIFWLNGDTYK